MLDKIKTFYEKNKLFIVAPIVIVGAFILVQAFGLDWITDRFQQFRYVGF